MAARVSGEQQRGSNTSAGQAEALVEYVGNHGCSGAVLERPGLERIGDLAAEGKITRRWNKSTHGSTTSHSSGIGCEGTVE